MCVERTVRGMLLKAQPHPVVGIPQILTHADTMTHTRARRYRRCARGGGVRHSPLAARSIRSFRSAEPDESCMAAPDVAPLVGGGPYRWPCRATCRLACNEGHADRTRVHTAPPPSRATTRATSALRRSPINCPGHSQPSSAVPSLAESCTACSSSYSARPSGESPSPGLPRGGSSWRWRSAPL